MCRELEGLGSNNYRYLYVADGWSEKLKSRHVLRGSSKVGPDFSAFNHHSCDLQQQTSSIPPSSYCTSRYARTYRIPLHSNILTCVLHEQVFAS